MEKVANNGTEAASHWNNKALRPCAAALAALACHAGWAQDADPPFREVVVAEARPGQQPLRLQVETSELPRFDGYDTGFQSPRVDLAFVPENARRTGIGPVLGVSSPDTQATPGLGLASTRGGIDLGLRFSHRFQNESRIDITAWRRMTGPDDAYSLIQMREQPLYGARVEMKIAPAKFRFGLDRGLLGFQLQGGARISVKRKDGRPMVYYRTSF